MTKITRRRFAASSAFAAAATVGILKSTGAAAQTEGIAFDYWHRYGGGAAESMERVAALYNESNEHGHTVTSISQGDIQTLNQKIRAAAAGGGLPGAFVGDDYDITQYAASGIITDLNPYVNDPEVGLTQEQQDSYIPAQLNRHLLDIYGGARMAFPMAFSAFAMWWNVEALQAAGFEAPVTTWAEFPDFAKALHESNPNMPVWMESGLGDRFIGAMKTSGIQWLKDDGETANFDIPEVLEIMTWMKELSDIGAFVATTSSPQEAFAKGETFLFMGSSASINGIASLAEFTYAAGLPPQGVNVTAPVTETYGPINALPANEPEIEAAGWDWLKFVTSEEAYTEFIPNTAYFPAVQAVAESEALSSWYEEYPVALTLLNEVAPAANILTPHAALTEIRGTITANVVNEVLMGMLSPEEGVQKLQAEAQAAIERAVTQ